MDFDLQDFLDSPCIEKINLCRKDDLICIAARYDISVQRSSLKREIRDKIVKQLVALGVLVVPDNPSSAEGVAVVGMSSGSVDKQEQITHETPLRVGAERAAPATLPRFDPLSPGPPGSSSDARVRVRLARLQLEAEEKERVRRADYELKLQVRKLEIEAEKEIKLRQIELEAMKISSGQFSQLSDKSVSPSVLPKQTFDVGKNVALVPTFREAEVDCYFTAFERIAAALDWPREMWPVLLHCKLVGKAQEVVSSLSLEDSLNYDVLKQSILRAYELVPEPYRQRFRNHKKASGQTLSLRGKKEFFLISGVPLAR